jgi:hypothetical protein
MTKLSEANEIHVTTSLVVIGRDPELQCLSNPYGEVYGVNAAIIAEAPDGSRWVGAISTTDKSEAVAVAWAEEFANEMREFLKGGGELDPAAWRPVQPCYGSEAYDQGDWEAIWAAHEREQEGAN